MKSRNIKIFRATITDDGEWRDFTSLPFNSDDYDTGHPVLSEDGKKLYFVSNMPGTIGDKDIFVVDINNGHYGKPINLGPTINSATKEFTPYIDGNIIYFSSNRKGGKGGFDIYMAKLDGSLSKPINLGEPMNSVGDDFSFIIDNEKLQGYFSSNRANGEGDDDIYSFYEDEELFIECLQTIQGVVRDKDTQELLPGALVSILDSKGNQLQITAANEDDATYSFDVLCNSTYTLVGTNLKYLKEKIIIKTVNDIEQLPVEQDVDLSTEFKMVGDELLVNIDVIYFDFDKHNIRFDASEELDKVIDVMNQYPEMKIFATSHTDSKGPSWYNMRLSKRRAKSTIAYILSKGIDESRITSQGLGESQLANDCSDDKECSDEEHQLNRRTNFKVVNPIKVRQE